MMKGIVKIKEDLSHRRGWITSSVISIIILHIIRKPKSKADNIHRDMFCVFFYFFCSVLVRNSAILSLDSLECHLFLFTIAEAAMRPGKYTI